MRSSKDTREQLLEVAVQEFARNGFEKTSVRSIAKAANASPALLIHYFATKDQLVKEAIIQTLGIWIGEEKAALVKDPETRISDWIALVQSGQTKLQFFRQVLLANNQYSEALFEYALLETKQMLQTGIEAGHFGPLADLDTAATLLTSQALANLVFLPQIENSLGGSITDEQVAIKLMITQQQLMNFMNNPSTDKASK
jgi:AcrR family transcriptional regulator